MRPGAGKTSVAEAFAFQYRSRVTPFAASLIERIKSALKKEYQYRSRGTPFAAKYDA